MSKNVFKATDEQLEELYTALKGGAPLLLALQYAGISRATYYYWVAVSCVVEQAKSQEELEGVEDVLQSGISIQEVRDLSESAANQKRTGISVWIEPSADSVLAYKNNRKFRKFANKCYEVIQECGKIRSQLAIIHLNNIRKSVDKGNRMNASGSMWFLERTLSDFFAKPSDKAADQDNETVRVEPVRVEFVDPNNEETEERVKEMEQDLLAKINGEGKA